MGELDERVLFVRGPVVVFKWRNAEGWPVEYVSPNAAEVFGHDAAAFRSGGVAYAAVVHPDDLGRVGAEVAQATGSGATSFVHEPYRIVHADGSTRWLHDVTQILRDDDGTPTHYLGYVVDISQRMRAEEEKRLLERQLLHAQKLESLGVLAGGVAHDFNNLLTGILGQTVLARRRLEGARPDIDALLAQVERLAERAADLTRQLLAYSGEGRFVVEPTDLVELVQELAGMLDAVVSKKARLRLVLEPVHAVEADRAQLHQLVMNLLTNASDALAGRPGDITVRTREEQIDSHRFDTLPPIAPGRYVVLEVADQGEGMSEAVQARLFEPFFSTKETGRGLGMAAISGILKSHGGGVLVCSAPGQGSTFTVYLPVSARPVSSRPQPLPAGPLDAVGTVLVVDDEPSLRLLTSEILHDLGFETVLAANGREALEQLRASAAPIVLIILDMMMPVMDGAETLRAIRALELDVPVVMTSGYDETSAISQFAPGQVAGFLQKPFRPDDVEAAVRRALLS